jgi:hypothetical protein
MDVESRDDPPRGVRIGRGPRVLFEAVYAQAFGLSVAYLLAGIAAEVLRRQEVKVSTSLAQFLDGLPLQILRHSGLLDAYLKAVVTNRLSPFWNRVLLAALALGAIHLLATLLCATLALVERLRRRPVP